MKMKFTDDTVLVSIDDKWYDVTAHKEKLEQLLFIRQLAAKKELYTEVERLDTSVENAIRMDIKQGRFKPNE
jgi:hypothetical protein